MSESLNQAGNGANFFKRRRIRALSKKTGALESELDTKRDQLRKRIDKWRCAQKSLMPQVGDHVERHRVALSQCDSDDRPEKETLFLPSDFSREDSATLLLSSFAQDQHQLLEGAAFDALHQVRTIIKGTIIARQDKIKHARGQSANTRATVRIKSVEFERDFAIAEYNAIRDMLISLGLSSDDSIYRRLELKDTERKRTDVRRAVGDSHRTDGAIWTQTGIGAGSKAPAAIGERVEMLDASAARAALSTQGSKGKKRKPIHSSRLLTSNQILVGAFTGVRGSKRGKKRRVKRLDDAQDAIKKDQKSVQTYNGMTPATEIG